MKRKYGWIPDYKDQRDVLYGASPKPFIIPLPECVDLRNFSPPINDQGASSSCVFNAGVNSIHYLQLREWKQELVYLSRLFPYYNTRCMEGDCNQDAGATIRNAIKAFAKYGTCQESVWPFDLTKLKDKPSEDAYKDAEKHKITSYQRLETHQDMLQCLAEGFPFIFGITIYESFESDNVKKTGNVPMPEWNERTRGGHAMLCLGYDLDSETFLFGNSWGEDWGQGGYGRLPFNYMMQFGGDAWVILK